MNSGLAEDARWMRRALRLARRGFTAPNPMVGCVLVKEGVIVGEGFHLAAGEPHAEAMALRRAGQQAKGATAYVTLEPCCHFGRTPPCVTALVQAGVARVVCAVEDPNPQVSGRGIRSLREAGVAVSTGTLQSEAERLNEAFFQFQRTGRPFVTLKAAVSLDGKIATRTGESKWISSEASRRLAHRMRAQSSAVVCGIGTLLADDPLLTARIRGVPRQPLRVVVDTHLRTPETSKLARSARESAVMIATGPNPDLLRMRRLTENGVHIVPLPLDAGGRVSLAHLMEDLARRELIAILLEGGGSLNAGFLEAGLVNRIALFCAPLIIGGSGAPTSVEGAGVAAISDAVRAAKMETRRLGPDLFITARLS